MAETEPKAKRVMPKGGRKGGTRFPRYNLADAVPWAKKLVSKTHLAPQPQDVIFSGVIGSKATTGEIKLSALRQYGLISGTATGYGATDLAKQIAAAVPEELSSLYKRAALNPPVFKDIFNTFHGDEETRGRLRQRAMDLKVHPDEAETCINIYIATMQTAALVKVDGDKVTHVHSSETTIAPALSSSGDGPEGPNLIEAGQLDDEPGQGPLDETQQPLIPSGKAAFNVNITIDSTMDADKLEKHLRLLRKYGAL